MIDIAKSRIIQFIGFIFCIYQIEADAQNILHSEILGRPTDESIQIKVFFDQNAEACIQFGTVSNTYTQQTKWQLCDGGTPALLVLSGLKSDTKYYYRLCYRKPGDTNLIVRPEYQFHTQRLKGSEFTFVVQADPHLDEQSDSALYLRCLRNQLEDDPDFMVDLGDIYMTDKLKRAGGRISRDTIIERVQTLRSYYETSCHSVPLFISLGNHEGEAGWNLNGNQDNIAVWSTLERKKYFVNPEPDGFYKGDTTMHNFIGHRENYYSWEWGDALFVVLDPYWYTSPKPDSLHGWRWTLGKNQYDWLRKTLEESTAPFKFVFAHQLIGGDPDGRGGVEFADKYEWGGKNLDGSDGFSANRPGWYKPIKDLLTENRVTIFFHGHDHFFGKQEKDCLIYQETPQPSHPNFSSARQATDYGYFEGQILPNSGHLRVTVRKDGILVEYVRAYVASNETPSRKNKDVSASYFIGLKNCYDSISTDIPILWNKKYADELVYPNPFQRQTQIQWTQKEDGLVGLIIYNSQGQQVRTLANNYKVFSGTYFLVWDGADDYGNQLPDGTYHYIMQFDKSGIQSGEILLMR